MKGFHFSCIRSSSVKSQFFTFSLLLLCLLHFFSLFLVLGSRDLWADGSKIDFSNAFLWTNARHRTLVFILISGKSCELFRSPTLSDRLIKRAVDNAVIGTDFRQLRDASTNFSLAFIFLRYLKKRKLLYT